MYNFTKELITLWIVFFRNTYFYMEDDWNRAFGAQFEKHFFIFNFRVIVDVTWAQSCFNMFIGGWLPRKPFSYGVVIIIFWE